MAFASHFREASRKLSMQESEFCRISITEQLLHSYLLPTWQFMILLLKIGVGKSVFKNI